MAEGEEAAALALRIENRTDDQTYVLESSDGGFLPHILGPGKAIRVDESHLLGRGVSIRRGSTE